MRSLHVYIGQRKVGTLHEGEDVWQFVYSDEWRAAPDGFDLAPGLPRAQQEHVDGGTQRPVQWYFDNLLPEELLRAAISKEADIKGDDAFALLTYLGAESAGSLVLLPPGQEVPATSELRPLADAELSSRIAALPRQTLAAQAPKRMSLAGAQHKLLVVLDDGMLYEPVGATPSTHILKPNHQVATDYPASAVNEYVTMRLAAAAGLAVPAVHLRYVPEPVYIIDRFDRVRHPPGQSGTSAGAPAKRRHIIDACQLMGRARTFKYTGATLETLLGIVDATTNKASTRLALYRWLVFNILVANDDAHLKNLSFYVSEEGIALAPHYDLLATAAYRTRAVANEAATWPDVPMAIALPGAATFADVTPTTLLDAGRALGVPVRTAQRILMQVLERVSAAFKMEAEALNQRHAALSDQAQAHVAGEVRMMRIMGNIIIREMSALMRP